MEKLKILSILLICLMALALMSCEDNVTDGAGGSSGGGGAPAEWSNVTSLNQLNGTWRGNFTVTMTFRQLVEAGGQRWDSDWQNYYGNMMVAIRVDGTWSLNASTRRLTESLTETRTFSGGNINATWSHMSIFYRNQGWSVNDSARSISWTSFDSLTLTNADVAEALNSGVQINRNRTQVRVPPHLTGATNWVIFTRQ